jgi:hypothetical protein
MRPKLPPSASPSSSRELNHPWVWAAALVAVLLIAVTGIGLGSRLSGDASYLLWVPREWLTLPPTPAQARLIISEIMYYPEISEPDAEWFELFNSGDFALVDCHTCFEG